MLEALSAIALVTMLVLGSMNMEETSSQATSSQGAPGQTLVETQVN
jgi:hypothetical protein